MGLGTFPAAGAARPSQRGVVWWMGRAVPYDEFGGEHKVPATAGRSRFGTLDCDGERGGRGSAFGVDVLTHGGERRSCPAADGVVVESDHGHVVGYVQAGVLDRADDAAGDGVGEAEDGGWLVVGSQDCLGRGVADVFGVGVGLADDDGFDTCRTERIEPAEEPRSRCRSVYAAVASSGSARTPNSPPKPAVTIATCRCPKSMMCCAAARAPSRSSMLTLAMPGAGA
jgi:hypothetical protein